MVLGNLQKFAKKEKISSQFLWHRLHPSHTESSFKQFTWLGKYNRIKLLESKM